MSIGQRLVTMYFLVAYALPIAGNLLFGEAIESTYTIFPFSRYSVGLVLGVYLLFLLMSGVRIRVFPRFNPYPLPQMLGALGRMYLQSRPWMAVIAASVALVGYAEGLNSYRYAEAGISEAGSSLLLLMIVTNVVVTVDLFHFMFVVSQEARVSTTRRLESLAMSLSLLISASGTASMFVALIVSFFSISPKALGQFLFVPRRSWHLKAGLRGVVAIAAVSVIFVAAWFGGETIKATSAGHVPTLASAVGLVESFSGDIEFARSYLYYLLERLSIYYYSLLFSVESPADLLEYTRGSVLDFPIESLFFRVDYLLGGWLDVARPEVATIMQLNYRLLTTGEVRRREGSAPGLLASFNYVLIFPFNVVFCALYLVWIARSADRLFEKHAQTLSDVGIFLLLVFVQGVFQSPFDFLVVVDDSALYLLLLLVIVVAQSERRVARAGLPASLGRSIGA